MARLYFSEPVKNMASVSDTDDMETAALREQAVEDAVESVPDNSTLTGSQTRQYTCSTVIREYVMARANGGVKAAESPLHPPIKRSR